MLSVIMYEAFMNTSLDVITNNSMKRLEQNVSYMNLIREQTYSLGLQMIDEPLIKKVGFGHDVTAKDKYMLLNSLRNVISSNNTIQSICLYNVETGEFTTSLGGSSLETNLKEKMVEGIQRYWSDSDLNFLPTNIDIVDDYGNIKKEKMISVFFVDKMLTSNEQKMDKVGSALIINLKASYLEKSIKGIDQDDKTDTMVINKSGTIVFNTSNLNQYVDEAITTMGTEGSKIISPNGKKSLLVYKYDKNPVWEYVSISSFDYLFNNIYQLKMTIVIICFVIFVITFLLSLLSAYNIYLPFDRLLKLVRNYPSQKGEYTDQKMRVNDIQLLAETFVDIMKRTDELELSVKNTEPMIKKAVIRKIISGEIFPQQDGVIKYNELLNVPMLCSQGKHITSVLISIDDYGGFTKNYSPSAQSDIKSFIEARIVKLITGRYIFDGTDFEDGNMILLLCINEPSTIETSLMDCFRKMQEDVIHQTSVSVSCAIGLLVQNIEDIVNSYNSARDMIKYRFVYGGPYLSCYNAAEVDSKVKFIPITKSKEKLLQAIRTMNIKQVNSEMGKIFSTLQNCQYDYIKLIINQLVLDIINSVQIPSNDENIDVNFNNIYDNLNKNTTLDQAQTFLVQYCQEIVMTLEKKNNGKKADMINDALTYIEQHYFEFDLNLDGLANVFNFTPGYFSKLFNEYTGKAINEYISDLRLSKSRVLLLDPDLNVNEISSMVGFANVTYFITVFKKHMGCTPNQYRINQRRN